MSLRSEVRSGGSTSRAPTGARTTIAETGKKGEAQELHDKLKAGVLARRESRRPAPTALERRGCALAERAKP